MDKQSSIKSIKKSIQEKIDPDVKATGYFDPDLQSQDKLAFIRSKFPFSYSMDVRYPIETRVRASVKTG